MTIDLSSLSAIQTNYFVKIDIPGYEVLTFSDYHIDYDISGTTYQGLGQLLSLTNTTSELRATPQQVTIQISGIPDGNISDVLNQKIKGSSVEITRGIFDPTTSKLLTGISPNPAGQFQGIIENYEIDDEIQMGESTGTNVIVFTCTSIVELLYNKVAGRRTNPIDQRELYPNDPSMDRVPSLAKSNFNFGAPE